MGVPDRERHGDLARRGVPPVRVELVPGVSNVQKEGFRLEAGTAYDLPDHVAGQLIAARLVKRADIPWIQNDRVIIVDFDAGPPVGVPQ